MRRNNNNKQLVETQQQQQQQQTPAFTSTCVRSLRDTQNSSLIEYIEYIFIGHNGSALFYSPISDEYTMYLL